MEKRKVWHTIDVKCDGWRSWERLGNEVLDWEGVIHRYGGGHADFVERSDFFVNLYVKSGYARRVYERIKKYPGTIKGAWTNDSAFIVKQFG